jgi:carboxyl-terminal processing protease
MQAGLFSFLFDGGAKSSVSEKADLSQFWEVWDLLEKKYVSSTTTANLTPQQRVEGAIKGLVASYNDPYTVFLPPSAANMFEEDISGNFGGVGMEVGLRDGLVTVIAPLPDTPAAKAGIVAKDVIVEINGTSTEGMGIDEAVRLIRGEEGTTVNLKIYREGETGFLEKSIVRGEISIPTIDTEKRGDIFIIKLYSFNAIADTKMEAALEEYAKSGSRKLILDLRGNPGGFLQGAVSIASYFIPSGKVVVRENFGGGQPEQLYRSQGRSLGEYAPQEMLVLVDGGSASASEILAGALQEHGIAKLLGDQTYGKGSVQELVDLKNGASLKVTVARWFTPNGISISDGGLTPDILVKRTPQQVVENVDPQLDAAIKWLHGDHSVGTTTPEKTQ